MIIVMICANFMICILLLLLLLLLLLQVASSYSNSYLQVKNDYLQHNSEKADEDTAFRLGVLEMR